MLLNNCIFANIPIAAICELQKIANGILVCKNNKKISIFDWLIYYLSTRKKLYDIVLRAIAMFIQRFNSIARTKKEKENIRIRILCITRKISIVLCRYRKNSSFYMLLFCKKNQSILNLKGGDAYD